MAILAMQVINTVKPSFFPFNMKEAVRKRELKKQQDLNEVIHIDEKILKAITSSSYLTEDARGRGVNLLKASSKKRTRSTMMRDHMEPVANLGDVPVGQEWAEDMAYDLMAMPAILAK